MNILAAVFRELIGLFIDDGSRARLRLVAGRRRHDRPALSRRPARRGVWGGRALFRHPALTGARSWGRSRRPSGPTGRICVRCAGDADDADRARSGR